jgi:hypothetical protein
VEEPQFAWQPLTPRGVAAFARASNGRLLLVQLVFALLACAVVVEFLSQGWFPAIRQAIDRLPPEGDIRGGKLDWRGTSPAQLAQNRFLAFAVDLDHHGLARSPAHIDVQLGRDDFQVHSLLGFTQGSYPRKWIISFNRTELMPWWGAWAPALLGLAALAVIGGLLGCWAVLAALYAPLPWSIAFFADRKLDLAGAWRVAGAGLMPGCLLMSLAILLYGFGALDLVQLAAVTAVHFIIGWIYLIPGALCQPRIGGAPSSKNPFAQPVAKEKEAKK